VDNHVADSVRTGEAMEGFLLDPEVGDVWWKGVDTEGTFVKIHIGRRHDILRWWSLMTGFTAVMLKRMICNRSKGRPEHADTDEGQQNSNETTP